MQTLVFALLPTLATTPQAGPDPAERFTADCLAYVEADNGHDLLVALAKHPLLDPLQPEGGWLSAVEHADPIQALLAQLEERAGQPALSLIEDLSAGGAAFSLSLIHI